MEVVAVEVEIMRQLIYRGLYAVANLNQILHIDSRGGGELDTLNAVIVSASRYL